MRSRLFWKILFAFWLTFFCIVPAIWLPIAARRGLQTPEERFVRDIAPSLPLGREVGHKQGRQLHPVSDEASSPGYRFISTSWQVLLVGILSGLPFSVALGWYLTRPIKLLRDGFRRMADGDLNVRLAEKVGGRRDEIADLAQDFDRTAAKLNRLVTARDRLLHDVSHELRSPISRLQVAIGLARQDSTRIEPSLDRIEREAGRLSAMVHELLVLARAEGGAEQVPDYFDPVAVIEGVVADARFEAETSGVTLRLTVPDAPADQLPSLCGSAELFRRCVENVVRNALRFSPKASTVAISVGISGAEYRIAVMDDGPGISHEDLPTVFEPFVSSDPNGFGLGLAIARRAILAHGGTIEARNRVEGGLCISIGVAAGAPLCRPA